MKHLIIFLLVLSSCGTSKTKLSSDGKRVKMLKVKDKNCHVMDKVVGENEKGSEELAENHARNLSGNADGNAMYIDEVVANGPRVKVYATAYHCPED